MKLKTTLFLLILILLSTLGFALDCQYTQEKFTEEEVTNFYDSEGNLIENPNVELEIRNTQTGGGTFSTTGYSFEVYNPLDIAVEAIITYPVYRKSHYRNLSIDPEGTTTIKGSYPKGGPGVDWDNIKFEHVNIVKKDEIKIHEEIVCKTCQGKTCLNDGEACSFSKECGGKFCVAGYCSNNQNCYENNCQCKDNEIQCRNKKCVEKGVVPIDAKPECGLYQECETRYINTTTGLCAKSPTQLKEEKEKRLEKERVMMLEFLKEEKERERAFKFKIITWILSVVTLGLIILIMSKFIDRLRREKIIKEEKVKAEKEKEKIRKTEKEIEELERQIERKRHKERELKKAKAKLEKREKELDNQKKNLEANNERIRLLKEKSKEPYFSKSARAKVWINPKFNYYECYYNERDKNPYSDNLVHRKIAEKWAYKRYRTFYQQEFEVYQVHHINEDKYDHRKENLIILTPKQHKRVHRVLNKGKWKGLDAIKRTGIIIPPHLKGAASQKKLPHKHTTR
jgi:hypothetical protein